jgi:catechol 2,3-dioxygenase-like lactoylglutathione lyase family enzyme
MSSVAADVDVTRFHLSLNVNDLEKSVHFLTALLGCEPKKLRGDYAKFEPVDLPIVLSLEPRTTPAAPLRNTAGEGPLNHVGVRLTDSAMLVDVQRRIEAAGYTTQREEGVECCYAKQTKFWVHDHDRTMWEVYVLEEDLEHRGGEHDELHSHRAAAPVMIGDFEKRNAIAHRLTQDFPADVGAPGSVDEVLLQGSFNAKKHEGKWGERLAAIRKALKPGGKLIIHTLTASKPMSELKPLAGPAAVVQCVPALSEVLSLMNAARFTNILFRKYAPTPCFTQGDVEMRETRLEAVVDGPRMARGTEEVMYKGPAERVASIDGFDFPLGQRVTIPCTVWKRIEESGMGEAFVRFAPPSDVELSCGMKGKP